MSVPIKIPSVGESITEATVARIIIPSGSGVKKDDEILELETDKVNQVVYAPSSGIVSYTIRVGQSVQVGEVVGQIAIGEAPIQTPAATASPPPAATTSSPPPSTVPKEQLATPTVRIDQDAFIASLQAPKIASNPPALSAPKEQRLPKPPALEGQSRKKMSALRKTIARRLVDVKNQTAMLTTFNEVDMSEVMAIRNREKERFEKNNGVKLGFMSFFVKATVAAIKAVPEVNAFIDDDEIVDNPRCNISISVATEKGLMVPVLKNADSLTFAQIERGIADFAKKARDGKLAIEDLQGGTFTITNGGVFGSMLSTPILNPPQSAILGMHNIVKRAVVINDQIVIRPIMYLALSYDHRIIDGKEAVTFLVKIKEHLEDPAKLLLDS